MDEHTDYLWYIIPGALALFPLAVKFFPELKDNFLNIGLGIAILFIVGFIIHQIYRLIYGLFVFNNRKLIKFLKRKLKEKFGLKIPQDKIDSLYNYFIYSNKQFESRVRMIKRRSYNLSSLTSCIIGVIVGTILILIFLSSHSYFLVFILSYIIFLFICIMSYIVYSRIMLKDEKTLIIANLNEFDVNKINEILIEL